MAKVVGLRVQKNIVHKIFIARLIAGGIPDRRRLMKDLADAAGAAGISEEEMFRLYLEVLPKVLEGILGLSNVRVSYKKRVSYVGRTNKSI